MQSDRQQVTSSESTPTPDAEGTSSAAWKDAVRGQPLAVQLRSLRPGGSYAEQAARQSPDATAAAGFAGGGGTLPHIDRIQQAFGRHDVSSVQHYSGPAAQAASRSLGASAYAMGDRVGSDGGMDLHTAAHEAAHVVQQRGGVQLKGGLGQSGDAYETHADMVADAVVRGESAEGLLDASPGGGGSGPGVQLSASNDPYADLDDIHAADARRRNKERGVADKKETEVYDADEKREYYDERKGRKPLEGTPKYGGGDTKKEDLKDGSKVVHDGRSYEGPNGDVLPDGTSKVVLPNGVEAVRVGTGSTVILKVDDTNKGQLYSTDYSDCGATVIKARGSDGETYIVLSHVQADDKQGHFKRLKEDIAAVKALGPTDVEVHLSVRSTARGPNPNDGNWPDAYYTMPPDAEVSAAVQKELDGVPVKVSVSERDGADTHIVVTPDGVKTYEGDFRDNTKNEPIDARPHGAPDGEADAAPAASKPQGADSDADAPDATVKPASADDGADSVKRPNPPGTYRPDRKLPRDTSGNPVPDVDGPHTQLGKREGRNGDYTQAREFDTDGKPVADIDFTDHNRPKDHFTPHQHVHEPNETGGTPKRGSEEPLTRAQPERVPADHVPVPNQPDKPAMVPDDHVPVPNAEEPAKPARVADDHVPVANGGPDKPAQVADDHVPVANGGPDKPARVADDHVPATNGGPAKPAQVPDNHVPVPNADAPAPSPTPAKGNNPEVNVKPQSPESPKTETPPDPPKQKVEAQPKADGQGDAGDAGDAQPAKAQKPSRVNTQTSGHLVDNDDAPGGKKPSNHSTEVDLSNISKGKVDIAHNFNLASINTTVPIIGAAGAGNGAGLFLQVGANAALKANASIEVPPDKDTWTAEVGAGIGGGGSVSLKAGIQVDAGPVTAEATVAATAALNINTGTTLKVEGNKESWRVVGLATGLTATVSAQAGATATLQAGVGTMSAGHTWNLAGPYTLPILQASYPIEGKGTFALSPEVKQLGAKIGAGISNAAGAIKKAAMEKVDGFVDGVTGLDDKEAERLAQEDAADTGNAVGAANWRSIKTKSGFYKYKKFVKSEEVDQINDLGDNYIRSFERHKVNSEKGVECDNWSKCMGYREQAFEVMKGVKDRLEKAHRAAQAKRERESELGRAKGRLRGTIGGMAAELQKMYYQARTAKERGASQGAIHNTQFDACNNAYHGLYKRANTQLNAATQASQCDAVGAEVATLTQNMKAASQKLRGL